MAGYVAACRWGTRLMLLASIGLFALPTLASAATAVAPASQPAEPSASQEDWLGQAAPSHAPSKRGAPLLLSISITALSFAALATRFVLKRRGLLGAETMRSQDLVILAQRSLGGAHQLVLVEACGERLLIGRSAEELTLLSHLPMAEEPATAAADGAHQAQGLAWARAGAPGVSATAPSAPASAMGTGPSPVPVAEPSVCAVPRNEAFLSADLRGLHSWRQQPNQRAAQGGP